MVNRRDNARKVRLSPKPVTAYEILTLTVAMTLNRTIGQSDHVTKSDHVTVM